MKHLGIFLLYFSLAHFAKLFDLPHDLSSLFFPAAGLAIVAILIYGVRALIPIFLGCACFIFSLSYKNFNYSELSSYNFLLISLIATIQAYVGYLLCRSYLEKEKLLATTSDVMRFILYPSLLTPLIGAFYVVYMFKLDGGFNYSSLFSIGSVWYLGDAIGTAFGLTTFLALFGRFNTQFNSRRFHVLSYSALTFIFILFYFLTTINQEKQREVNELRIHSNELFFRIENEFEDLSARINDLRNLIYSSQVVEEDEFNTFLSGIFQNHKGVEYVLWTSAEKDLPISYSSPQNFLNGKTLFEIGILDYIKPSIINGDYELFITEDKKSEYLFLSLPVFKIVPGKRVRALKGVLVVKVRSTEFISDAYTDFSPEGHRLEISFKQGDASKIIYDTLSLSHNVFEGSNYNYHKAVRVFNKQMDFKFTIDQNYILNNVDNTFLITGVVGLFFTILTSIVGLVHSGRNLIIYDKVKKRTSELTGVNERLLKNQFLQAEFLISTGHEIKTMITSLFGLISLLKEDKAENKNFRYYDMMKDCADEVLSTVNDMIDVSNLETAKVKVEKTPFSVGRFIQEIENSFVKVLREKKIDFEVFKDDSIPDFVVSDRERLRQVITILIDKSIQMTVKGKIQLYFHSIIKNGSYYFKVHIVDTGEGLTDADTAALFVPFDELDAHEVKKFRGSGIAFSLCYRIISALGGQISYQREPEEGKSHYLFEIPVEAYFDESGYGKAIKENEKKSLSLANKRILLVEDNEINQMICYRFFEKLGAKYDLAENAEIAIDKVSKTNYDIIFMDYHLPLMNGKEASRVIRELKLGIEPLIIGMSTTPYLEAIDDFQKAGMDDYLAKPFQFSDMLKILTKYFSTKV